MGLSASELRIGNLISDINGNLCLVKTIREDLIIAKYYDVGYCIGDKEQFNKVELTEELLLKFGFKYDKEFDIYFIDDFAIRGNDFVLCDIDIEVKFEYVHRLQNAYFELKNKELCFLN